MAERFPAAVPELPVADVDKASAYYVDVLGFTLDWGNEEGGIAGISQGDCRLFLTSPFFRGQTETPAPVTIWLNCGSRHAVDELFDRWQIRRARVVSGPEDKPWNLREFRIADLDGNQLRVFYDFAWERHPSREERVSRTA
jgi:uncharacterized glyoxalase superfamily protein PhnB